MNRTLLYIVLTLLAAAALPACDDNGCYDNGSAIPLAKFIASGTTSAAIIVSPVTVAGIGAPGDSLLLDSVEVSETYLPLRATTETTAWKFIFDNSIADTITFHYKPIPYFVGADCGAMYYFQINSVTTTCHVIDSVKLIKPLVTNSRAVSLHIFISAE